MNLKNFIKDTYKGHEIYYNKKTKSTLTKEQYEKALEKQERIKQFRAEASRKVSIANKRIKRLEESGLTDSPAYKKYIENGQPKFGIKGKSYNEVQAEVARLERFLNAKTSTITGVKEVLKNTADLTGIKYKDLKELKAKASSFFELLSKTQQYLRNVEDIGSAFDSNQIVETIREYVQKSQTDLNDGRLDLESMVSEITKALKEYDDEFPVLDGFYSLKKDE